LTPAGRRSVAGFQLAWQTRIGAVRREVLLPRRARHPSPPPRGGCPVGIAVSCSADRQAVGKITADGVFLEQLETDPARFLADIAADDLDADEVVHIDLNRPMADIRVELGRCPVKTRVMLTGPMVVARDIAHAKIAERLEAGDGMPDYLRDHCVYYAGPAKTPEGYASGSFGPTTAGRMDAYVESSRRQAARS